MAKKKDEIPEEINKELESPKFGKPKSMKNSGYILDINEDDKKVDLQLYESVQGTTILEGLKLGKDELIARTEVTKKITQYCKEHSLQKEEDKRTIHVDAPLRKLLRLGKGDELTFFNLQKYMKIHYPNKDGVYVSA